MSRYSPRSAGWSWRLELECCERKILLGWLELEAGAGMGWEENTVVLAIDPTSCTWAFPSLYILFAHYCAAPGLLVWAARLLGGPARSFIVGPHSQYERHKICRIFFGNCKYVGPTNIKRHNPPRRCALEFEKSPSPSPLYHLAFFVFSFLLKICDF